MMLSKQQALWVFKLTDIKYRITYLSADVSYASNRDVWPNGKNDQALTWNIKHMKIKPQARPSVSER